MTPKEMLEFYRMPKEQLEKCTFERMLDSSLRMHELDPISFKWLPFLEQETWITDEGWCVMHQCVAMEKGWA
jgi:hypothetical protein